MATLEQLIEAVNKKKRDENKKIIISDPKKAKVFPRLPTGIFPLDRMLAGGFPIGVASCIYGREGSGKTNLLFKLISSSQKFCWRCYNYEWDCKCDKPLKLKPVLIATEIFEPEWAEKMGVDLDNLILLEPAYGEEVIDLIKYIFEADDCGLIALDSLAMLTPVSELESSGGDNFIGIQARLIRRIISLLNAKLIWAKKNNKPRMFVCTNQIRVKIGEYGKTEEVPGGYAAKHEWHLALRMAQLSNKKEEHLDNSAKLPYVLRFKASCISENNKKKIKILAGACEFFLCVRNGFTSPIGSPCDMDYVIKSMEEAGFIRKEREGKWILECEDLNKVTTSRKEIVRELVDRWQSNEQEYLSFKKRLVEKFIELDEQGKVVKDDLSETENEQEGE